MRTVMVFFVFILSGYGSVLAQPMTLDQCLAYALDHNRELLARSQAVRASGVDRQMARAQLVPEVEAAAGVDHYWQIPVQVLPGELIGQPGTSIPVRMGTPWMGNYGLEASLKLVDVQAWQQIREAALREQAAQSEFQSLQKSLVKNVRMAFYQVQLLQENRQTATQQQQNYADIHRLIALQYENGLTDKITLNQSVSMVRQREEASTHADAALQGAFLDLKFWMGYPLEDPLEILPTQEAETIPPPDFAPDLLPDYHARFLRVELARQAYKAALAPSFPSLHLSSGYRRLGFGDSPSFISNSNWFPTGFVGVQVRVPLFSLSKTVQGPHRQRLLWQQADSEFAGYQEQQKKNFLQARVLLNQARQTVARQRELLELAEENERLSRQKIEKGVIDLIQLRQVQQDMLTARENLQEAQHQYLKHYVELSYLQSN